MGIDKSMVLNGKYKLDEYIRFNFNFSATIRNTNNFLINYDRVHNKKGIHIVVDLYTDPHHACYTYNSVFYGRTMSSLCLYSEPTDYMLEQFKFIKKYRHYIEASHIETEIPEHFISIVRNMISQKIKTMR